MGGRDVLGRCILRMQARIAIEEAEFQGAVPDWHELWDWWDCNEFVSKGKAGVPPVT